MTQVNNTSAPNLTTSARVAAAKANQTRTAFWNGDRTWRLRIP